MKLLDAQQKLLSLKQPVLETQDAAACLKISIIHASQIMNRLAKAGIFVKIAKGKWATSSTLDPFILAQYLTSPFPAYISLQSALYHHGMISQIPNVIYAISLARTKKYKTSYGDFSVHHIIPELFFDYDYIPKTQICIASPEKALFDVFYLNPSENRLFRSLPELEIPKNFKVRKLLEWAKKIKSKQRRTIIQKNVTKLFSLSNGKI